MCFGAVNSRVERESIYTWKKLRAWCSCLFIRGLRVPVATVLYGGVATALEAVGIEANNCLGVVWGEARGLAESVSP
jgi:hypothetical protein